MVVARTTGVSYSNDPVRTGPEGLEVTIDAPSSLSVGEPTIVVIGLLNASQSDVVAQLPVERQHAETQLADMAK